MTQANDKHMFRRIRLICLLFILFSNACFSQTSPELRWIKHQMATLSNPTMAGRGYVKNGRDKAARLISRRFREFGLQSFSPDTNYYQEYTFNVNTFPGYVWLSINKKPLDPGVDFLVDASSSSFTGSRMKVKKMDMLRFKSLEDFDREKAKWNDPGKAYYLKHTDSFCSRFGLKTHRFGTYLPKGCFIVPRHGKLIWTVATKLSDATTFYVEDTVLPKKLRKADVEVRNVFLQNARSKNVIGYVRGTAVPDSFIVFSAHYDHLGAMGNGVTFPGANDNASGTALLLYLAKYYAAHPQRYSIAFIAFSGEEAGLLGSEFYVRHPLFPVSSIRFLINMDMVGDATAGITAVNATEQPEAFSLLQKINSEKNYLSEIKSRGKTANSDHHHFVEKGVPAFFIYANSGPGHYHDVFDRSGTITMKYVDKLALLLADFVHRLQE